MEFIETYAQLFANRKYSREDPYLFRYQWAIAYLLSPQCDKVQSACDIGAGRGVFLRHLKSAMPKIEITAADLKDFHGQDCRHIDVDLNQQSDAELLAEQCFDFVSCLDVLEHLHPECVPSTILAISRACKWAAFTVANHSDKQNDVELHLTQEGLEWWRDAISINGFDIVHQKTHYDGILYAFWLRSTRRP